MLSANGMTPGKRLCGSFPAQHVCDSVIQSGLIKVIHEYNLLAKPTGYFALQQTPPKDGYAQFILCTVDVILSPWTLAV
ncbi:hypothetical protein TURU_169158 [Turdus rufiventris]|nr:hypothetical protein TURU_169158 [Turdus rufiventris]